MFVGQKTVNQGYKGPPAFLRRGCIFPQGSRRSAQNYNRKLAFMKNTVELRSGGVSAGLFGQNQLKSPFLGDRFAK